MNEFHFLRPEWFALLIPLLALFWILWQQKPQLETWAAVCDRHLLEQLMQQNQGSQKRRGALLYLLAAALCMLISLAGPTWSRLPVPTYQQKQPRVIVLDMSNDMLAQDLLPNRLERAKFKLHDLFKRRDVGQFALLVYTGEPFVVSPLTDDAQTIDALLSSLTTDVMPVSGQRLDSALEEASQLIIKAGYNEGQILVLTAKSPSREAIIMAKHLAKQHIFTSVIPVIANPVNPSFKDLALAGEGQSFSFSDTTIDIEQWINNTKFNKHYNRSKQEDIPLWRDEGRWFLLPAFIFLLPVFRRGWLQRIIV
jgi:Ca-activated chloride channel homolog